ncbi:uncharacterized protein LY79DRAFT_582167 [Colletotrichum navitas]|uniref:Uncharacterized protein n=1 Tax=Colletotrichum navitas TaxID=681940 RepID=A0AAD8PTW9_9PEZI|nr:uncharacterized protein LY79DRAFT_582167 [Colletotrichum navitas]KAK1579932.1 hypothetical protein LY79DRAFT_582167 [Colletotrichum navitas]
MTNLGGNRTTAHSWSESMNKGISVFMERQSQFSRAPVLVEELRYNRHSTEAALKVRRYLFLPAGGHSTKWRHIRVRPPEFPNAQNPVNNIAALSASAFQRPAAQQTSSTDRGRHDGHKLSSYAYCAAQEDSEIMSWSSSILDPGCSGVFDSQSGAIRRIIVNFFGNALKSFSQEDPLAPGTGLGLSLVKRMTSCTSVTVTLPLEDHPTNLRIFFTYISKLGKKF